VWLLVLLFLGAAPAWAEDLGELSANPFNLDSTSNPFGAGSPFKPDGLNNPFSPYGSLFSNVDNLGSGMSIDLWGSEKCGRNIFCPLAPISRRGVG
jgi:hypothetical protein